MGWIVYYEHDNSGFWVVTENGQGRTRCGPFESEADVLDAAVDQRQRLRDRLGFAAFAGVAIL
jgi:hypothetical protein